MEAFAQNVRRFEFRHHQDDTSTRLLSNVKESDATFYLHQKCARIGRMTRRDRSDEHNCAKEEAENG